jgi:2,4-dienoyl-CoA reductase (NADPH2)
MRLEHQLLPTVAATLSKWHAMVEKKDLGKLVSLLHPDATFRSPMAHRPYGSAQAVALILNNVMEVFSNFTYHRQFASEDGFSGTRPGG